MSELMQVVRVAGYSVDRPGCGAVFLLPQVASDFANYLRLYDKYKQVYRVDELLFPAPWEPVRASNCGTRRLTKKLGVLRLLLSGWRTVPVTRTVWMR